MGYHPYKMAASMRERFRAAVERVLNSWTVLKLAVSHGFGGSDSEAKAEWMVFAVDQWFTENSNVDPYEVEGFLEDVLDAEFDTIADDGSVSQIAHMICGFYKLCQNGDEEQLQEKLSKLPQPAVNRCQSQQGGDGTEDSDDDDEVNENGMDHDPHPQQEPTQSTSFDSSANNQDCTDMEVTEDDGWTTVGKKGKRR